MCSSCDERSCLRNSAMTTGPDHPRSASASQVGVHPDSTTVSPGGARPVTGERPPATARGAPKAGDGEEGVTAPYMRHFKDSLAHATVLLGEIREYATHYGMAKVDRAAFILRRAMIHAALGVIGAVVGVTALVCATALLLGGLSAGLGILLGDRRWLGALIVGAVVLVGTAVGAYVLGTSLIRESCQALEAKYEGRRRRQREAFGRDVATAASVSDTRKGEDRAD